MARPRFRYSPWDGTQVGFELDALDVMEQLTDDLLYHGDVNAALRLQEAGAVRYGLLSTPDGSLLVVRPETAAAEALLEELVATGLDLQRGWAVVALVGEGLRQAPGRALGLLACGKASQSQSSTLARGGDIGWLSEMEAAGINTD